MPAEPTPVNPYRSPTAGSAVAGPIDTLLKPKRRFRWRLIPTTFLYSCAAPSILMGLVFLAAAALAWFNVLPFEPRGIRVAASFTFLVVGAAQVSAGYLLLAAARACWRDGKTSWWRVAAWAALGLGLFHGMPLTVFWLLD
ncbi:MAG: hypothetical protein ACYTG0_02735 [Planctomycetota bacterium]|jgi:hypothetical protein